MESLTICYAYAVILTLFIKCMTKMNSVSDNIFSNSDLAQPRFLHAFPREEHNSDHPLPLSLDGWLWLFSSLCSTNRAALPIPARTPSAIAWGAILRPINVTPAALSCKQIIPNSLAAVDSMDGVESGGVMAGLFVHSFNSDSECFTTVASSLRRA